MVFEKVKKIISEQLGIMPCEVTKDSSFKDDLGASSIDMVVIGLEFEKEFSVEIPEDEWEKLETVGEVVKYIEGKI